MGWGIFSICKSGFYVDDLDYGVNLFGTFIYEDKFYSLRRIVDIKRNILEENKNSDMIKNSAWAKNIISAQDMDLLVLIESKIEFK